VSHFNKPAAVPAVFCYLSQTVMTSYLRCWRLSIWWCVLQRCEGLWCRRFR